MATIHVTAGGPISIDVKNDNTLLWRHEDVRAKEECTDIIDIEAHPVKEWDPLAIEGALVCAKCGLEGSIYNGRWLRIFKREPGQTLGEGYAAWRRYLKNAEELTRKHPDNW